MKLLTILNSLLVIGSLSTNYYLYTKTQRNFSTARLALFSAYCNQYYIRSIWNDVLPETRVVKSKYVVMPPVCIVQNSLELLDAVKFRGYVPKYYDMVRSYDSYFTGKGYNGQYVDKMHEEYNKKYVQEYQDYVKDKLGVKKSVKELQ